jgi:hypothetical protein
MAQAAPTVTAAVPPRHIAIIMDGNGRWARQRSRPRTFGHAEGVEALRRTVEAAGDLGVAYLTVFGFSTENWRRPIEEVNALFDLLRLYVARDLDRLAREGVRVRVIGDRENLQQDILEIITAPRAGLAPTTSSISPSPSITAVRMKSRAPPGARRRTSRPGGLPRKTSLRRRSSVIWTPLACRLRICSCGHRAKGASRISCCGKPHTLS